MKPPFLSAVLVCFLCTILCIACEKDCEEQAETCPYDDIENPEQVAESLFFDVWPYILNAPDSIATGDVLPIELLLQFPNPCFGYRKFIITETSPFEIGIRVKTLPRHCNFCEAVIFNQYFDTSIILPKTGTYTISSYHREALWSSIVVEAY